MGYVTFHGGAEVAPAPFGWRCFHTRAASLGGLHVPRDKKLGIVTSAAEHLHSIAGAVAFGRTTAAGGVDSYDAGEAAKAIAAS